MRGQGEGEGEGEGERKRDKERTGSSSPPNNCSLGTLGVQSECALHLGSPNSVPTDIDDIVHPACDPVVPILIPAAAISREVEALHFHQAEPHQLRNIFATKKRDGQSMRIGTKQMQPLFPGELPLADQARHALPIVIVYLYKTLNPGLQDMPLNYG